MRKLSLLCGLFLLVAAVTGPALAQDEWECSYNFTESDFNWIALVQGEYTETVGFEDTLLQGGNHSYRGVTLILDSFAPMDLTSVEVIYSYSAGTLEYPPENPDAVYCLGESGQPTCNLTDIRLPGTAPSSPATWTGTQTVDVLALVIQSGIYIAYETEDPGGSVTVTMIVLEGTGVSPCATFVKPLLSSDEDLLTANLNELSTDADNAVFAFSYTPGASVFAAAAGTITEMRRLNPETDCDDNFNRADSPFNSHPCQLLIPGDSIAYYPDGGRDETQGANVWLVRLFTETGFEFTYFVEAADYYLTEGQTVEAGCIMGRTFAVEPGNNPPEFLSEPGLAIVNVREAGTIVPLIDSLNIEPVESAACNINPDNANCLGDVQLNDPAQWESSSGVAFNEPGYTLLGGFNAHLRTTMNLDPLQKPELIVVLRGSGGNGNFELTLGQTTTAFSVSEAAGFQTFTIEGDTHEADGTFYTVRILNSGTSNLDVQSICVRFTDDGLGNPIENPDPPAACIFSNNSFNDGTTGWTVTGTEPGPGELRIQTGGTFAQNVSVPAGSYTLNVVAAIWHYNNYSPDDQSTDDVEIEYTFDGSPTVIDTYTYGDFAQNNNLVVFSAAVEVAADTTDDFSFEVTLTSPPTGVRGLAIRSVCLDDGSGGGSGGGGDGDGIFTPTCGTIATPAGNDLSTWLSWHWAQLNKFYRCELMILLNNLYKFLQKSWITTTWSIRWSQAATVKTVNWFGAKFVPWLGGHLSNIAIGQVTNITTAEQCGNVFCLLQSLVTGLGDIMTTLLEGIRDIMEDVIGGLFSLLSTALNAIINFLQQILSFIFSVLGLVVGVAVDIVELLILIIGKALELFEIIRQILDMLLNAWLNSTPIEWDMLPSCQVDATHFRCMFFYMSERTIFTESGPAIFNTIIAGLWMNLFFFVIYSVKNALITLGILS